MNQITQNNLNDRNIYSIPVGSYFEKDNESVQMIYAPFTQNTFLARPDFVERLNNSISNKPIDDDGIKSLLKQITPSEKIENYLEAGVLKSGFNTLLILPNNICNFSCSYCYSAKGRSGKKLTKDILKVALDDFVNPKTIKEEKCFISILGGGEPLITWDLIRFILEYGTQRANHFNYYIWFSLVTNGSVMSDEMIHAFQNYNIRLAFSFEILEEIQNLQRGHFKKVSKNLKRTIKAEIPVRIRSTITRENVLLQEEMVQTVIQEYPEVKTIILEEVTDEIYFDTPEKMREFYNDFSTYFRKAFELGKKHLKNVECSTFRNNNLLIDRFCPGVLCLTPEGSYTICSRISSPNDSGYNESIWGKIEQNKVKLDNNHLKKLINGFNVYSQPKCKNCYTKWHCGGGCYAHSFIYSNNTINIICDYKKKYLRERLLNELNKSYKQKGISLKEFVLEKIS